MWVQNLHGKEKSAIMGMGVKHYRKDGKEHKGGYHKMPNGQLHSGKTHGKTSKRLYHFGELSKTAKMKARKRG